MVNSKSIHGIVSSLVIPFYGLAVLLLIRELDWDQALMLGMIAVNLVVMRYMTTVVATIGLVIFLLRIPSIAKAIRRG